MKWICFLIEFLQAKYERNKKNKAKMETNHTAGTSTFVNVIRKNVRIYSVKL
jgi:hypothetical protein